MKFSLYSHDYGGNVLSGIIHSKTCVAVTWIAGKGDVDIICPNLAATFKETEYSIDRLKYYCSECKETLNCMFGRPCSFMVPKEKKLTLWKGLDNNAAA